MQVYYLSSTVAPASSSCFLKPSASALSTPAFKTHGADSTFSLASFKPSPVTVLAALITATLLPPKLSKETSKVDFSSAAASPPPAAAGAGATAAAATAVPVQNGLFATQGN